MQRTLAELQRRYPALQFTPGKRFCWSPETEEIFYVAAAHEEPTSVWSLLHETGHALLGHTSYKADFELIQLEMAAWQKAQELAAALGVEIDEEHIQDCLDTYRDWLYKRSICPRCTTKCLQQDDYVHYRCFNCHAVWRVTPARFARPYRSSKNVRQPAPVFHLSEP